MGIISSYTVGMSLRHKRRHDETNTLTSVTAPADYYVILIYSSQLLAFLTKARLVFSAWFLWQLCTLLHKR